MSGSGIGKKESASKPRGWCRFMGGSGYGINLNSKESHVFRPLPFRIVKSHRFFVSSLSELQRVGGFSTFPGPNCKESLFFRHLPVRTTKSHWFLDISISELQKVIGFSTFPPPNCKKSLLFFDISTSELQKVVVFLIFPSFRFLENRYSCSTFFPRRIRRETSGVGLFPLPVLAKKKVLRNRAVGVGLWPVPVMV